MPATALPEAQRQVAHAQDWFALHLYLSDAAATDRFLLDWVMPQVRRLMGSGAARGWFFLRYWEGGPHLRLRVRGLSPAGREQLLADARAAVPGYLSATPPTRDDYYRHHFFDGQPLDLAQLPWFDEGCVQVMPYDPEWRRYGGLAGLPVNEGLFDLSSTLALSLVRASAADVSGRLQLAAGLMPLFAQAWQADLPGVARFLDDYVAYWTASSAQVRAFDAPGAAAPVPTSEQCRSLARNLARQLHEHREGPPRSPAALLRAGLAAAMSQWEIQRQAGLLVSPITDAPVDGDTQHRQALQAMLASQLHMLNNRLGLAPMQEVALARSLARTAHALVREAAPRPLAA
jgi:thiopeptide-type bacteriocin biosynthesis protein